MKQTIYLKSILAGFISVGLSQAAEQRDEKTETTQITSVERVENTAPSIQKKASTWDIWKCILVSDFHRQFKADFVNDILPDEVKAAVHQIDPTVTDEKILEILKAVAYDEDHPSIGFPEDDEFMARYGRVSLLDRIKDIFRG